MKSEKMTPLLQSMWLQVLWILWTLWFVLDPAWDLFASGVEWLLSMGVLGWFLGLVALALAVSLVPNLWSGRRDSVHNGDLSVALGHWGWAAGGPPPQPLSAAVYIAGCHL